MLRRPLIAALALCALLVQSLAAIAQQPQATPTPTPAATQPQQQSPPKDPNDPIERIKDEGLNRSQVMQTLSYLTDVIGPRLTDSPGMKRANEWTRDKLAGVGPAERAARSRGGLSAAAGRSRVSPRTSPSRSPIPAHRLPESVVARHQGHAHGRRRLRGRQGPRRTLRSTRASSKARSC